MDTEQSVRVVRRRKAERTTALRDALSELEVNGIGLNAVVGVGLFIQGGAILYNCGPGLAIFAYLVALSAMWAAMGAIGEPTALFPVKGCSFEHVRTFVGPSFGYAAAWNAFLGWALVMVAELVAITNLFRFRVDQQYLADIQYPQTSMEWFPGGDPSPAVWISIALPLMLALNLLPARIYGQVEYWMADAKLTFISILICILVVIASTQDKPHFWTWSAPLGFGVSEIQIPAPSTTVIKGSGGTLLAFITGVSTSIFSLMGWEITLITAPENRDISKAETIKISGRKIGIRVTVLYLLCILTVGFIVPRDDEPLRRLALEGATGGENSVFVLAALRGHVLFLPHFLNGFFIFSAFATGLNCLWSSSRILHAIACQPAAWPRWPAVESIRRRLEETRMGVPMNAVFASWLFGFLAFLCLGTGQSKALARMIAASTTSALLVYAANCYAYLNFYQEYPPSHSNPAKFSGTKQIDTLRIEAAAAGKYDSHLNITRDARAKYDRSSPQFPWRVHLGWLRAVYGLGIFVFLILAQGWRTLVHPIQVADFVANYIMILVFFLLVGLYWMSNRDFSLRSWRSGHTKEITRATPLCDMEAFGRIVVEEPEECTTCRHIHRPGELLIEYDVDGGPKPKLRKRLVHLVEWAGTWIK